MKTTDSDFLQSIDEDLALRTILEGTVTDTGEAFFDAIVVNLARGAAELQRIRSEERLRASEEEYRRIVETAGEVQQSLLPPFAPFVEGLDFAGLGQPCEDVGGDYFDFIEMPGAGYLVESRESYLFFCRTPLIISSVSKASILRLGCECACYPKILFII